MYNPGKISNLQDIQIERRIVSLRKIYFVLLLLGGITVSMKWRQVFSKDLKEIAEIALQLIIYASIYIGLKRRNNWVIAFILIVSAFGFIWGFFYVYSPAQTFTEFIKKMGGIFLLIFFGYQLIFFTSQNVRKYYGIKGRIIF